MKHYVVIVAGGIGKRMNSPLPKQFIEINEKPIIFHTIEKFLAFDLSTQFIISLHKDYISLWEELLITHNFSFKHTVVTGGEERFHSVKNALVLVPSNSIVGIHDAVRPYVSQQTIKNCFEGAKKHHAAIPVINVTDTIRLEENNTSKTLERVNLRAVQTPQYFYTDLIKNCYSQDYSSKFTDDASVVEAFGSSVFLVDGNIENIKITSPVDLTIGKNNLI
jgi:2-C-methyl-D-erythritol 4-phosphate cytidylyltransferase